MQNQAEVVRFESQLTVPTRSNSRLSDLWVAISCTNGVMAWAPEFRAALSNDRQTAATAGTLEVVAMSERQGWVVARGVDLSAHDSAEIVDKVRAVVMRANLRAPTTTAVEIAPSSPLPWSRLGAVLKSGGHTARRHVSSSRVGPAVDAVSGR